MGQTEFAGMVARRQRKPSRGMTLMLSPVQGARDLSGAAEKVSSQVFVSIVRPLSMVRPLSAVEPSPHAVRQDQRVADLDHHALAAEEARR